MTFVVIMSIGVVTRILKIILVVSLFLSVICTPALPGVVGFAGYRSITSSKGPSTL